MLIVPVGISLRLNAELRTPEGQPVSLQGYDTAVIKLRPPAPATAISLSAVIDDAASGKLHADATPAQLATVGEWAAWAVVTWPDGRVAKTYGTWLRVVAEGAVVSL